MGDALPHALGGLPDGAPKPPTESYKYPNVYDTPTPRSNAPLDDQGQLNRQNDLQKLREQQQKLTADPELPPPQASGPPASPPAKKKPAAPKTGQATGAKTNP